MTNYLYEELAVLGKIAAMTAGTGTSNMTGFDMSHYDQAIFYVLVDTIASTGTVDVDIEQSTDNSNWDATAIASITQLTDADDDKEVIIQVNAEKMGVQRRYLRAVLTRGTANSEVYVLALGGRGRVKSAEDDNIASVDEIVTA